MGREEAKTFMSTMLREAPGHAIDIATALRVPFRVVEGALDELSRDGVAECVTDSHGTWYRWVEMS